ncbi:PREDICTED: uncharacterized protein LOC109218705 [Nicotiana attenuata]|uniref:uncharacterized protein LOC109218705 n=1 Tax=Nicotiana attenuata TaxID=49451 RepID=UPI000905CD6C|nr:PREDICTED: uncharacterized protein LOC109218705 [Nicotiana attenuata]
MSNTNTDPTSPLFVHSSDILGVSLVPVPFSGSGFWGWKRKMIVALSAKNKIAFVDGTCPRPTTTVVEQKLWDRYNNMVISWLTASLSPNIAESVQYSETAQSIWAQLQSRYGTANRTKIFELKRELTHTSQGPLDIASYFNKLKGLWDELGVMCTNHGQRCTCAAKPGIIQEDEENRLFQFLMGLNETYMGVRSNLLMMQPPPSLDCAYNILLNDEKQRQVQSISQFNPDSMSFNVNTNNKPGFTFRVNQAAVPNSPPLRQYTQRVNFDQTKASLFCRYCKKSGHLIDKCYKLHGYPQSPKFNKGKKAAAHATIGSQLNSSEEHTSDLVGNLTESHQSAPNVDGQGSVIPGLSRQQYQLITLLQQTQLGDSNAQAPNLMCSANFAGTILTESPVSDSKLCMLTKINSITWIIDSGASDHITSNKSLLFNITPLAIPYLVTLPNGYKVKVTSTGSFALTPFITLHNVLFVPSFQHNLISVHKLIKQLHCIVLFTATSYFLHMLQAPSLRMPLDLGKEEAGLYKLTWVPPSHSPPIFCKSVSVCSLSDSCKPVCSSSSKSLGLSSNVNSSICNNVDANDMNLIWHLRLAHIPFANMKHISVLSSSLAPRQSFPCAICPMAKQTRLPFPDSSISTTKPFQLIHIDTWGPYHTPTSSCSRYFLTIVDDFSRATWTHLLGSKSNAFSMLKSFLAMVKTQFNTTVQTIRSDNALELGSILVGSSFFSQQGIIHQTTCPHTPQQNGIVERKHRTLLEACKALLFQSKLPVSFWGDCLLTATYLLNRIPSRILQNKSPYEVLYGKTPTYSHVPIPQRDKLKPRAIPCVFLGYPFAKKGYKLYDLASKKCFVSRDVFHETCFPFATPSTPVSPTSLFPPPTIPASDDQDPGITTFVPASPPIPSPVSNSFNPELVPSASTLNFDPAIPPPSSSQPDLRRSTRLHNTPSYLKDYVCQLPSFSGSTSSTSPLESEPLYYSQAALVPAWQDAMSKEFDALAANHT